MGRSFGTFVNIHALMQDLVVFFVFVLFLWWICLQKTMFINYFELGSKQNSHSDDSLGLWKVFKSVDWRVFRRHGTASCGSTLSSPKCHEETTFTMTTLWFQMFVIFIPIPGEMIQFRLIFGYFGLKTPTWRWRLQVTNGTSPGSLPTWRFAMKCPPKNRHWAMVGPCVQASNTSL